MTIKCEYCSGAIDEGETKCGNCGAPFVRNDAARPDFRFCPFCHRRLLALASPACNYCGRRLPDEYIKTRESDLKRIAQVKEGKETSEVGRKLDELIRQTALSGRRRASSPSGLVDIANLIDLLE